MRTATIVIILSLGFAATPAATAVWSAHGSFEPDYAPDVTQSFMYPDPDHSSNPAVQKVYFNVVLSPDWSSVNPNSGALRSRIITASFQAPTAFLGVWKDCNRDGYIGMAESAVLEYRSELLLDKSVCPDGSSVFNWGGWVYEFRWIGPEDSRAPGNSVPRMINDTGAFVWGDVGLPGGGVAGGCYVNPQTGTFSSTGAMVSFADCLLDRAIAQNLTQANDLVRDTTGRDLGLAFEDEEYPQCDKDHPLNVPTHIWASDPRCPSEKNGLYERHPDREQPAWTVWDCSRPSGTADVRDPTAAPGSRGSASGVYVGAVSVNLTTEKGSYVTIPGVAPRVHDPRGDHHDALNHTVHGTHHCERESTRLFLNSAPYATPESTVAAGSIQRESTFYFTFRTNYIGENTRRGCPGLNTAVGPVGPCAPPFSGQPPLPPDTPQALGVHYPFPALGIGPTWYSSVAVGATPPLVRDDLQPASPRYYTFYARVGSMTTSTGAQTPGGTGIYGSEWCAGNTSDVIRGFDCNPERWWKEEHGATKMPMQAGREVGQKPGASYNLRDIDCYDGSVAAYVAPGVGLGLTWLNRDGGPCANP